MGKHYRFGALINMLMTAECCAKQCSTGIMKITEQLYTL